MASVEVPPVEVTLKLTQKEADALYFLLINLPTDVGYRNRLQEVVDALETYRQQIYG